MLAIEVSCCFIAIFPYFFLVAHIVGSSLQGILKRGWETRVFLSLSVSSLSREAKYFAYPTLHELLTFICASVQLELGRRASKRLGGLHLMHLFYFLISYHIILNLFCRFRSLELGFLGLYICKFIHISSISFTDFFWANILKIFLSCFCVFYHKTSKFG